MAYGILTLESSSNHLKLDFICIAVSFNLALIITVSVSQFEPYQGKTNGRAMTKNDIPMLPIQYLTSFCCIEGSFQLAQLESICFPY